MLVGALDSGTSSTRFVLYTSELEVVASAVRKAVTVHGEDGQQEQSAGQMLEMADQCMAEALETAGVGRESVATIGVANQRETAVVWDRRSGEALHAALLWSDQRSELSGLVGRAEEVEQETGLPLAAYFTGGKFAWLLAHGGREMQQVYEQGQLMGGTVDAWLLRHLTGSPSTEPSNASRTLLFSLAQHAYAPSMIARLGLDKLHLPVILPSLSPLRLILMFPSPPDHCEACWPRPQVPPRSRRRQRSRLARKPIWMWVRGTLDALNVLNAKQYSLTHSLVYSLSHSLALLSLTCLLSYSLASFFYSLTLT